jgi:hypothetical protein
MVGRPTRIHCEHHEICMQFQRWNKDAARSAQRWAAQCMLLTHDNVTGRWVDNFGSCGQNIFVSTEQVPWWVKSGGWSCRMRMKLITVLISVTTKGSFNHQWLYSPLLGPDLFFFSFTVLYTFSKTPWMGISQSKDCHIHRATRT